ncbi:MAG: N-acetyltransferase [Gemmatimonadaceae bacterium]|nr:N-acetyltransferase [Gemmatimonadaceae bacterium]
MSDKPAVMVREVTAADAGALAAIYNHYVRETVITFEEEPVTAAEMWHRIEEVHRTGHPYIVAEEDGEVIGYAYASLWKSRSAYRHTTESTVYLAPGATGRGAGTALYAALLDALTTRGFHAVLGGIALPNAASVALHEKLGFRKVAHFEQTGFKFGGWVDVGYWERIL